jgi:lipopolysaccharide/colanic/teichoic acid biosynthesis glycosyltransferase
MLVKRIFDIVVAALLLLVSLPVLLITALGILISSPGPVLYMGLRTGRGGQPFRIFKFRTMMVDAERKGGGTTALGDPRIFPFGRFLRRYKLDELPQFLNVLRGEMSLVGPRPELPVYTDRYTGREKEILSVRPGITDLSSIRFSSLDEVVGAQDADRVFEEKVLPEKNRLRLHYVQTWSFGNDLKILFMTGWCIVRKIFR